MWRALGVVGLIAGCGSPANPPPASATTTTTAATPEPSRAPAFAEPAPAEPVPAAPDPDDTRPADLTIPVPAVDFAAPLPDGVPPAPPVDGWWKKRRPCPKGSKLVEEDFDWRGAPWRVHRCDGPGVEPLPSTAVAKRGGPDREEAWNDAAGERHGGYRMIEYGVVTESVWLHGKRHGRETYGSLDDGRITLEEHFRDGGRHGRYLRNDSSLSETGYVVDGWPDGTWLQWRGRDGAVRSRRQYVARALHGAQRWWYPDGAVLARGQFDAGVGAWDVLGPDGRVLSRVSCAANALVELTAWDAAGAVTLHICGATAPAGCKSFGPQQYLDGVPLGAAPQLCDSPSIAPLGIF